MDQISVAMAARQLGMSERGLRYMISTGRIHDASRAGGPAGVLASDVDRLMYERRTEAMYRHPDADAFAAQIRLTIWPDEELDWVTLADGRRVIADTVQAFRIQRKPRGQESLRTLNPDAVALFGRAAVEVAAMDRAAWTQHCRWCFADASAKALGGLRPVDSPAYRTLLGASPCALDVARWKTEADTRRAADRKMAQRLAQQERATEQSAARREFTTAQQSLQVATEQTRAAARRLAAVDPAVAVQAAAEARRAEALKAAAAGFVRTKRPHCACTADTYCPEHARQFRTRRPGSRR